MNWLYFLIVIKRFRQEFKKRLTRQKVFAIDTLQFFSDVTESAAVSLAVFFLLNQQSEEASGLAAEDFKIYRHKAESPEQQARPEKKKPKVGWLPFLLTFILCMLTWVVLSGQFDIFHLSLGVFSSALVAYSSGQLLFSSVDIGRFLSRWIRFIRYLPWLMLQIFIANMHVMKLVFHPRMLELINPRIVRFTTRLEGDMARFILANSITLTPGTITVFASLFGNFTVHVIDDESGQGLPGEMENRVGKIYGE